MRKAIKQPQVSISTELFARGVIAIYVLNFFMIMSVAAFIPLILLTLAENGSGPYSIHALLFFLGSLVAFNAAQICFWGVKSLLHRSERPMAIFLLIMLTWLTVWYFLGQFVDIFDLVSALLWSLTIYVPWKRVKLFFNAHA